MQSQLDFRRRVSMSAPINRDLSGRGEKKAAFFGADKAAGSSFLPHVLVLCQDPRVLYFSRPRNLYQPGNVCRGGETLVCFRIRDP